MQCSGDASQLCGGDLTLALYRTGGLTGDIGNVLPSDKLLDLSIFTKQISVKLSQRGYQQKYNFFQLLMLP